ncbi:dopaminechrome tautomerase-like [Linepithema humile]|uniref:dopaminechrome tautomerase-like n=1 Tax=Linepithema humile TaxID=83485 RepID=UPI0006231733|nr:PREDICTED: protein yellow-like [Linepithema humile]XP_012227992.1 PREDICTED: protein yellow-like [Linepithema humile]XP_012227993.1 PREDICTED: protein yellow-like [Linepithema humile]
MKSEPTRLLRIIIPFLLLGGCASIEKLKGIHSWKALEFAFPNKHARDLAILEGRFIPGAPLPLDVDFYHKAKQGSVIFVSIPRFQNGVPVTLGYVTDNVSAEGNPIIAPYPNWEWNIVRTFGHCDGITSVWRMQVDSCDRLWVLDTGKVEDRQICRPQLLSFSLRTNKVLSQYKFPKEQFKDDSLFVTLVVDNRDTGNRCHDTFVYIADVTGYGLLVYDHRNSRSWRITNNLFHPYPPHGTFNIKGDTFDLMDGILGLALSPLKQDGDKILYFHSLASKVESWVPTSIIRNYSLFREHSDAVPRSFRPFVMERSSQSAAQAMDQNGVLFFGLLSDLAIGCWNSLTHPEYGGTNTEVVVINPDTLQFPSGMKIITAKNGRQELWVLTSSFQKLMAGTMSANETNFRIQAGYVDELIRGTKCNGNSGVNLDHNRNFGPPLFAK